MLLTHLLYYTYLPIPTYYAMYHIITTYITLHITHCSATNQLVHSILSLLPPPPPSHTPPLSFFILTIIIVTSIRLLLWLRVKYHSSNIFRQYQIKLTHFCSEIMLSHITFTHSIRPRH